MRDNMEIPGCTRCKRQIRKDEFYYASKTYSQPEGDGCFYCERCARKINSKAVDSLNKKPDESMGN